MVHYILQCNLQVQPKLLCNYQIDLHDELATLQVKILKRYNNLILIMHKQSIAIHYSVMSEDINAQSLLFLHVAFYIL